MGEESSLLQRTYIQKSKLFLLPLTGVKRDKYFKPTNTYISAPELTSQDYKGGISPHDQILIITYSKSYKQKDKELYDMVAGKFKEIAKTEDIRPTWDDFEAELMGNPNFLAFHESTDEYIYTYDLSNWSDDWKNFISGRYSLFTDEAKKSILNYRWSLLTQIAQKKLYCYLYPYKEECRKSFAEELDESVEDLARVKELCNRPNLPLETYKCTLSKQENLDEVKN